MNPWNSDIHLSKQSAAALVASQFPKVVRYSFRLLSSGWDNDAYLADDKIVFRFPRRMVAANLIEREIRILPLLEPHLPLPISLSKYVGRATQDYPFTWAGYDFMRGVTACRLRWTDEERTANAEILGAFLKALHSIPVDDDAKSWAPGDELARTDIEERFPKLRERLANLPAILPSIAADRIEESAKELTTSSIGNRQSKIDNPVWVHGDLYSRHILAENKKITGVIDWGDVHLGDRAVDLSLAFTFLPPTAHEAFRQAYVDIDQLTWQRAKFRAIYHAAAIAEYGADIKDADLLAAAEFCLQQIQQS